MPGHRLGTDELAGFIEMDYSARFRAGAGGGPRARVADARRSAPAPARSLDPKRKEPR